MQECIRIDNPELGNTERLLTQILPPLIQEEKRVRFLCDAGTGDAVAQRIRVMISRKRKALEARGGKPRRFRLHSSVHSETHEGKRFDCLILWHAINEMHIMTQELEDLLQNG
jgi:hypothetical protein